MKCLVPLRAPDLIVRRHAKEDEPTLSLRRSAATAAISTIAPHRPSIFLGSFHPLRGLCTEGTNARSSADKVCASRQRSPTKPFCHSDRSKAESSSFRLGQSGVFVISTGAQRSGEIWPAIGLTFPFEARFIRYVMLRLTSVANAKIHLCFFRRIIAVFLRSEAEQSQSRGLRLPQSPAAPSQ
jgi:hypothetical protein